MNFEGSDYSLSYDSLEDASCDPDTPPYCHPEDGYRAMDILPVGVDEISNQEAALPLEGAVAVDRPAEKPSTSFGGTLLSASPIKQRLADEIDLQESLGFQLEPQLLASLPDEVAHLKTYNDRFYLPPLGDEYLKHSIIVASPRELIAFYKAAEELCGGVIKEKYDAAQHEGEHAAAAKLMGQQAVRFAVRVAVQPSFKRRGRQVRPLAVTPSFIMEDVTTSLLGIGVMLNAPKQPSDEDIHRISELGLSPERIAQMTRYYNEVHDARYPIK